MKSITLTLIFFVVYHTPCFSQVKTKQVVKPQHSINIHYALTYAADVELDQDRKQHLPGLGYQYTSKKNWYIGADFQYDRNKRPDYFLPAFSASGFYTYKSSKIPGGIGYFTQTDFLANDYTIVTSDSIFKTPVDQYPVAKRLQTERYNFYLHGGKRWQKNKNQFEAGISLQATLFRSFIAITDAKELPVPVIEKSTGAPAAYLDGIRYVNRVERDRLVPGAGLHVRYQYNIEPRLSIGIQSLATASEEGIYVQFSPRLVYRIK